MSIDEQEKVNDENKEKGLTNAGRSKEESVSGIRCAVCKREFPSMPSYYEHIPCLGNSSPENDF